MGSYAEPAAADLTALGEMIFHGRNLGAFAVPHNTLTNIPIVSADVFDPDDLHDPGAGSPGDEQITIPADDTSYTVLVKVVWTLNTTGDRGIQVLSNVGAVLGGDHHPAAGNTTDQHTQSVVAVFAKGTIAHIVVRAFQNSTVSQNINLIDIQVYKRRLN